jgi:hypothetical protein
MPILIVIGVLLTAGVIYLLRSKPPPEAPTTMSDADAATLRDGVLRRLQERLVGWSFETPADKPYELVALEAAGERRIQMNLEQLGRAWFPLYSRKQINDADDLLESFVAGVTGQEEGSEDEVDQEALRNLLALRLTTPDRPPAGTLSRPAGSLVAVLVLRDRGGLDPLNADDLEGMGLSTQEAFQLAFANLSRDVDEGLELEPLDGENPPGAVAVAPHDPLASSYALVPGLVGRLRKATGDREPRLYLDRNSLVAAVEDVEVDRDEPLLPDAIALDELAWRAVPQE